MIKAKIITISVQQHSNILLMFLFTLGFYLSQNELDSKYDDHIRSTCWINAVPLLTELYYNALSSWNNILLLNIPLLIYNIVFSTILYRYIRSQTSHPVYFLCHSDSQNFLKHVKWFFSTGRVTTEYFSQIYE